MANILIIDDDKRICDVMTRKLVRVNHTVSNAYDLTWGLSIIRDGGVDLVFLDLQFPDGSGLDILPQIRELECAPEVIVITGYADPKSVTLALNNGAWDYLQKPFLQKELLRTISHALE